MMALAPATVQRMPARLSRAPKPRRRASRCARSAGAPTPAARRGEPAGGRPARWPRNPDRRPVPPPSAYRFRPQLRPRTLPGSAGILRPLRALRHPDRRPQGHPAHAHLDRLEVQTGHRSHPHQRFDLPLDCRPHRRRSPLFRRRGSRLRRRGSRLPSRSPPGIAQRIAGLDKFPRQVLETAIRRDLRPHLCFRRRRNVPRHHLPRPLPRQQKLRMSRVPWTRTMTARRAAPPKPPPQRTGTHRANRRHLTGQLCAAPFQNIDLYIGHRADPPPDGIPPTASYRQFRLPSAPLLLPSTFLTCTLPAGSRLVCQSDFRGRYFVPGLGPGFAGVGALASIRPTIHSASCRVSVRPAAIAGEVRSVLCTRQKL